MPPQAPLNLAAVVELATSQRRERHACRVVGETLCGSLNRVVFLKFDDGLQWVFRTPRYDTTGRNLPPVMRVKLIASEVATLNLLTHHTTIPVPRVIDHSCTDLNSVGVPYILMTCAKGRSFVAFLRHLHQDGVRDFSHATAAVTRQLGKICFALSQVQFGTIGSVQEGNELFGVGEALVPTFVLQGRYSLSMFRGPFLTEQNYYNALIDAFFGHVKGLSLSHHLFLGPCPERGDYPDQASYKTALDRWNDFVTIDDKIDSSENRIQYHTAGKLIQDIVPDFSSPDGGHPAAAGFPLGHADLSSSNIFVDDDCNITCIIGWEFSSTMPFAQLFVPPGVPNKRRPPSPADCAAFRAGLHDAAKQANVPLPPIPGIVSDLLWHYMHWVNLDTLCDFRHFEALFKRHPEFSRLDPLFVMEEMQGRTDIREARRRLMAGVRDPDEIRSDEDAYFALADDGEKQRRVAEKLTEKFHSKRQVLAADFWMQTSSEVFAHPDECGSCSGSSGWEGNSCCCSQTSE